MSDARLESADHGQLRQSVRAALGSLAPSLHVLAEDLLGERTKIDLVGVEPGGRAVLVLVGQAGEDAALVTRALAQRAWVEARVGDWLKLAPGLEFRVPASVRAILLCPAFDPETVAAATSLGPEVIELATYRQLPNGGQSSLLLERVTRPESPLDASATPGHAPFRSGLTESDLNLTPEEVSEFK